MKHLRTITTAAAILGIILVMLAAMAFQINSAQIAKDAASVQGPAAEYHLAEAAFDKGDHVMAVQYANSVITLLGNETSSTQDLLRYNALVLKGRAQLANGEVPAARNTLALACGYKSTWGPAYYYRGVAHFVLGEPVEAQQDLSRAIDNGLPPGLLRQAEKHLILVQEVLLSY